MKIKVLTCDLQSAIKKVNAIVCGKDQKYTGVKLELKEDLLIVKKSNAANEVKVTIKNIEIEDKEENSVFIPAGTIKIIEKLKNVIYLTIDNEFITAGKKKITFNQMPISEYWTRKTSELMFNFEITEKEITRMLTVKYAMAKDDTRPILAGVNIQDNIFAALDGYRLSLKESHQFKANTEINISAELVKILGKIVNKKSDEKVIIFSSEEENNCVSMFKIGDTEIISAGLEGEYIDYKQIIPEDSKTVIDLDADKLIENMEFIELIKSGSGVITKFDIKDQILTTSGNTDQNVISDEIEIEEAGPDLLIAFNADYILETMKQYKGVNVSMEFTSAVSPVVIRENGGRGYTLDLILPVRIMNMDEYAA